MKIDRGGERSRTYTLATDCVEVARHSSVLEGEVPRDPAAGPALKRVFSWRVGVEDEREGGGWEGETG